MRLVVLSYSHHGRGMSRTAHNRGHEIIGVMDGADEPRRQLEGDFECPGFSTGGSCLDVSKPDAALISGKHIDIPYHIQACVDRRIPYLVDKPFADCAARLRPVAEVSDKHGVFSGLTLPNRASHIMGVAKEMIVNGSLGELVLYTSRLSNGPPSRYDPTPFCLAERSRHLGRWLLGGRGRSWNRYVPSVRRAISGECGRCSDV